MNSIGNLPEEMFLTIVAYLEPEDINNLSQTCCSFRKMCNSYQKTINQIFAGLSAQQDNVTEEINQKYTPFKALQAEYDSLESLIMAPLVEPRKKLSEIFHKGEEIYSQKPVSLEEHPVASDAGVFQVAKRIQTEHQQLLQLREQEMHDHMQLLDDARQHYSQAEKVYETERKTKLEPLRPALAQAKEAYEECLSLRTIENETLEKKQLKNRTFGKVIREIFKVIIGKEQPVVKIIETAKTEKKELAHIAASDSITVFISPKGLRTIILKSSKDGMRFIQEYIAKGVVMLSTSGPIGSASIYVTDEKGNLDLQALQKSVKVLKSFIEELCLESKDDKAAAAAS